MFRNDESILNIDQIRTIDHTNQADNTDNNNNNNDQENQKPMPKVNVD